MGVVSFSQAQQIAEIARVWHFCRFAKQHIYFLWLWIDAWAQICLLNLYNVDWHLERRYGRVCCEMWVGLEGVEHIGLLELCLWNEANIASLWSRMVVRPMRSLAARVDSDVREVFQTMHLWVAENMLVLDVSLVVKQILDRFRWFVTVFYGDVALRICQERWKTSKEHWMLYYKLHAGCQKPFFLVGFKRQRGNKKPWGIWKKAGLKTNQWDRISFDYFVLFKKLLQHKCFMKKHTYIYILWW